MILNTLETERLILRPFQKSEVALMQQLDLDQEVVRHLGHGRIKTLEESDYNLFKILNDYQEHGLGLFAVFEKSSGQFIGRSGLIPWKFDDTVTWEIGYSLKRSSWGHGFATEASLNLLKWAETNLNVPHVISLIHPMNEASIHVAKKIGMSRWKEITISGHTLSAYKKDFIESLI